MRRESASTEKLTGNRNHGLEPKDLCDIADGNAKATRKLPARLFRREGEIAGGRHGYGPIADRRSDVIGGCITGARKWIMPLVLLKEELRSKMTP